MNGKRPPLDEVKELWLSRGLFYKGTVTAVPGGNQFTIPDLAGFGAGKFDGVVNPYWAFVLRDAGGAAAAPQGEQQPITAYVTATGTFTTLPFTAAVGVGDEILIVSPYIAAMGALYGQRSGAIAYIGYCQAGMAASLNTIVCPNLGYFTSDTFNDNYQMIVMHNANAPQAPPAMEMRRILDYVSAGTFTTENFSANVEENDIVLIIHNSVAAQISVFGIADAGSGVGAVVDAARTEANDWWNGQTIMMLSGLARGQKRPIADFDAATDTITPAPNFDAAVAAGDLYVILAHYNQIVPRGADSVDNALTSDVVGRKDDTAQQTVVATASLMRYLKGLITALGNPTADALASITAKLGNNATDFATEIGYEGATALANKLTAARAALLDRIALLAAGGAGELTPARALLLDRLDALVSSRAAPGDQMALLAATIIAIRQSVCAVGDPADSIGKALYELYETGVKVNSRTTAAGRLAGVTQIFTKNITSASNAGDVTVATITTQSCLIKSIVVRANGAAPADLTSIAISGGAGKVVTFIDATTGAKANINAIDQQVSWYGAATLPATKTIVITMSGTGGTANNLQVDVEYESISDGGYLA